MPEQNFLAPGPKQSEFNTLNSTVTSISEQIANLIKSDTASGTTDGYGLLTSGKAISSRKILSARVSTPTTGIAATAVQVSTNWQFICTTIDNGYIKPYTNQSVTITYFYVD